MAFYRVNRGPLPEISGLTLPKGSIVLCTDVPQLRLHDGVSIGGLVISLSDEVWRVFIQTQGVFIQTQVEGKGWPLQLIKPKPKLTWIQRIKKFFK